MRESWGTRVLFLVAAFFLATGFAAGVALGPRVVAASSPRAAAWAEAHASGTASRQPALPSAGNADADRAASGRLAVAATALARVPQLRPEPQPPEQRRERPHIKFDDLPAPVQQVLRQLTLGRPTQWSRIEPRERNGINYFKAEFDLDGMEQEYDVDPQGKVLASETDVPLGEVPAPISRTIESAFPGAVLLEAERDQQLDQAPFYEMNIEHQGQRRELHISEDGRILRQHLK
jgi:hypothetical protein